MFLAYNQNIPNVEERILGNLSPSDLINTKRASRDWAMSVRRYIQQMGAKRKSDLLEEALWQPTSTYATVKLPCHIRDLTVNDSGEVYILGEESIIQLDPVSLKVKRSMMLDDGAIQTIQEERLIGNETFLFANNDGSQFVIRRFRKGTFKSVSSFGLKCDKSKSGDVLTREDPTDDLLLLSRNKDVVGLPMLQSSKVVPKCDGTSIRVLTSKCRCEFHKMKKPLGASDIVRLPNGTYLFAKKIHMRDRLREGGKTRVVLRQSGVQLSEVPQFWMSEIALLCTTSSQNPGPVYI